MSTTDPLLERSLSDCFIVSDVSQPELFHPTNRVCTNFDVLHALDVDHSSKTVGEKNEIS